MAIRRLPVIQEPASEDAEAAARPPWRWVLVGAGLLLTFWFPAAALVLLVTKFVALGGAGLFFALVATFALASLAAGYLVARFGLRTRLRHAVFSGLVAAAALCGLTLLGGGFPSAELGLSAFLLLSGVAAGFCALGAPLARRKQRPV